MIGTLFAMITGFNEQFDLERVNEASYVPVLNFISTMVINIFESMMHELEMKYWQMILTFFGLG